MELCPHCLVHDHDCKGTSLHVARFVRGEMAKPSLHGVGRACLTVAQCPRTSEIGGD